MKEEKGKRSTKKILISVGSIFILVLAAISFVFIPAMVQDTGTELPPFGYYDGKPIEYKQGSYFASSVQYYTEQAENTAKQSGNKELNEFNIFNNAFASTVLHMAYTQAVKESGYIVPDTLIDRNMRIYFYDSNNVFSQKLFNSTPDATKIELRKSIADNLEYMRYYDDLFGSQSDVMGDYTMYGLKTAQKETSFIKKMGEKQRAFEYATFDTSKYPREEAVAWGKEHKDLFTRYNMSVISVSDKNTAEKIAKQIKNNEIVFEDAVTEYSRNYYSGTDGKLTSSYNYQIKGIVKDESSLAKILGLEEGTVSDVIETLNGYSIFKSDFRPVEPDFEDEALIDVVVSYMNSYESGIIESYFMDIARDFANSAARQGFAQATTEYGATSGNIALSPLNYGNNPLLQSLATSGGMLSNAATNETFLKTAFSLQPEEVSTPIVLDKNIVVLKLTEEVNVPNDSTMQYLFYTTSFDRASINTAIMSSDKLENNLMDVFLKYAFN